MFWAASFAPLPRRGRNPCGSVRSLAGDYHTDAAAWLQAQSPASRLAHCDCRNSPALADTSSFRIRLPHGFHGLRIVFPVEPNMPVISPVLGRYSQPHELGLSSGICAFRLEAMAESVLTTKLASFGARRLPCDWLRSALGWYLEIGFVLTWVTSPELASFWRETSTRENWLRSAPPTGFSYRYDRQGLSLASFSAAGYLELGSFRQQFPGDEPRASMTRLVPSCAGGQPRCGAYWWRVES